MGDVEGEERLCIGMEGGCQVPIYSCYSHLASFHLVFSISSLHRLVSASSLSSIHFSAPGHGRWDTISKCHIFFQIHLCLLVFFVSTSGVSLRPILGIYNGLLIF